METNNQEKEVKKKNGKVFIPLIVIVLIIVVAGIFWYRNYSKYISTDDAYVDADKVSVSSKILGRISKIYLEEGDSVKKDMSLVDLDSTELKAQETQAIALKAQALSMKLQTEAKYTYDQEAIKVQQVNLKKANDDLSRSKAQFEGGVNTKEKLEHDQNAFESAQAVFEAAKTQLYVSKTQINTAQSSIESAQAQILFIETQLRNTRLTAAIDGVIAKKWLLSGDIAQPGQSIYTISNNRKLWITVYIEETSLNNLHLHQKASYTIDAFSGCIFSGKIYSIGANTASQFALIPPSNASGNFTKVTQRIPLKISIDEVDKGKLADYTLRAGMSAVVKIIK